MNMNKMWSTYVQTSEELYHSRSVRFREDNKDKWINAIKVKNGMNVLEVGCGSGLLSNRIKKLLPKCTITGIDRDADHISFARRKAIESGLDCKFVVGDALELPFKNNMFDACISHTVIEHIETNSFLSEQFRVLKQNGIISVLSVRTGLNKNIDLKPSDEEVKLMAKLLEKGKDFDKENDIGKFEMAENDFPKALSNAGFNNINIDFIAISRYLPDNYSVSTKLAIDQIEVNRLHTLDNIKKVLKIDPDILTNQEVFRLKELINKRFDHRIYQYNKGEKLWDMGVSVIMVVTGVKP